jgi:hypothetical protein
MRWTPLNIPVSQPFTDFSRWRLRDTDDGRHVWDFLRTEDELTARPSSNTDKYWLGLPLVSLYSVIKPSFAEIAWCVEFPGTPGGEEPAGRCPQRIHVLQKDSNKWRSLGG